MIDYFALGLTHLLILTALFRILMRDSLDREGAFTENDGDTEEVAAASDTGTTRRKRSRGRTGA